MELPDDRRQIGLLISGVELQDGSLRGRERRGAWSSPEKRDSNEALGEVSEAGRKRHSPIPPGLWRAAPSAGRRRPPASPAPAPAPCPSGSSRSRTGPESACPCLLSHTGRHTGSDASAPRGGRAAAGRGLAYLSVAAEESVRDGDVDVEEQRLQHAGLRGDKLLPPVGVVADVQEVLHAGRAALLGDRPGQAR